ncbi:unnamed protein product [Schistocephalus solidus]|uniref:DUF5597 domain-containing protein n=1 Tax=Schistocephalus solidus TaxID=70667 RepID=A0A183T969_SCHSO|nr:unnamed protein product [Schistocephalus solidus]
MGHGFVLVGEQPELAWAAYGVAVAPTGTPTPWDPSQVWRHIQGWLQPRKTPAPSPASGLLDSVMTPGSGVGGGDNAIAEAQVYYHLKLIHVQVTVPAQPFCGAYGGRLRTTTVELSVRDEV